MPGLGQRRDRLPQLARADRVDADRRLVEEDDRRVVQQPARDVQPLPHAARVALDPLLLAAGQADQLEQLVDPRASAPAAARRRARRSSGGCRGGEPLVEAALAAEDVADALAHLARVLDHVVAEHASPSPRSGSAA